MWHLAFNIASRYFFSKHKTQYINIIAIISMLVVAVGAMALIVVLSVFNGLEGVIFGLHTKFNPDIKIIAKLGKSFEKNEILNKKIQKIQNLHKIRGISEIIEDNALLRYQDKQIIVTIKGVAEDYHTLTSLDSCIKYGKFELMHHNQPLAVVGRGIQYLLAISTQNQFDRLEFWYPKRTQKINLSSTNPEKNFNKNSLMPAGIFSLEQQYDEKYVFVPLTFAQKLLEYDNQRTSIEVYFEKNIDLNIMKNNIQNIMGNDFIIQTNHDQQASLMRALKVEKLFVYITLTFILAVASSNIFFTLMMLGLEKKKDIAIWQAMGGNEGFIFKIFICLGSFIAGIGGVLGLLLGIVFCWLQQIFGFITLDTQTTLISAYPVQLEFMDFLYTLFSIIFITILASYLPAYKASKIQIKENL
jgi:lipoprotein-releasing system permease protein